MVWKRRGTSKVMHSQTLHELTWKRRGWASEMRDKPSATWALTRGEAS